MIVLALFAGNCNLMAQKPAVVLSDKDGWHKIGETTADFSKDSDKIDVLFRDMFAALKFVVTDAPIEIKDLDITFEDGSKQNVVIGYSLKKAGESSPEIDIKGAYSFFEIEKDASDIVRDHLHGFEYKGRIVRIEVTESRSNGGSYKKKSSSRDNYAKRKDTRSSGSGKGKREKRGSRW